MTNANLMRSYSDAPDKDDGAGSVTGERPRTEPQKNKKISLAHLKKVSVLHQQKVSVMQQMSVSGTTEPLGCK